MSRDKRALLVVDLHDDGVDLAYALVAKVGKSASIKLLAGGLQHLQDGGHVPRLGDVPDGAA